MVNVLDPTACEATRTLRRACVVQLEGTEVRIRVDGEVPSRVVPLDAIEQRVQVPWKPRDLADNLVIFRRRLGRTEDYVEGLRVRRAFVQRILKLLMTRGFWRQTKVSIADTCTTTPVTCPCPI